MNVRLRPNEIIGLMLEAEVERVGGHQLGRGVDGLTARVERKSGARDRPSAHLSDS